MMMFTKPMRRRADRQSRRSDRVPASMFESLEQRMVMYQSPMVTGFLPLTQLEDRNDSVVRILTNVGRIDIELFESLVPGVTANFRNYINNGSFDESFFHSLANGVMQGGVYKFDDVARLSTITPLAPIANGFSRSNLAQTLAMVPINSTQATNQFLINLQDNTQLNTQGGGYTVFGKVIQGWDIVTTIQALTTRNLNQELLGTLNGPFTAVPTTGSYNPTTGPTEATLVKIIDVETIKAPGLPSYYGKQYVYAEGSRSDTTTEEIDLVNQDTANTSYFQVLVHYESGTRDAMIYSGSIVAGGSFSLKVNDFAQGGLNLVRPGEKYTFDVRATRKMGVAFNHTDTGVVLGESFLMTPQIPAGQFKNYQFAQATKGDLNSAILVVEDLSGVSTTINVDVFTSSGQLLYFAIEIEGFRRGTLDFSTLSAIPAGDFSIWTTSLNPYAASLSEYKTGGSGSASDGSTAQGVQGGGRAAGALAGAYLATGGQGEVDVVYSGVSSFIIIDFTITLTNGTVLTPAPMTITQSTHRNALDLATVSNLPRDQFFTIQYRERQGINAVSASYKSEIAGDQVSTPFQINATNDVLFADGFTDPVLAGSNGMRETISIFNPYASPITFIYQLLFHFSDGSQIYAPSVIQTLGPLSRRDHKALDFADVSTKINSDPAFYHYSVEVIAAPFAPVVGGVIAQLTRVQNTIGQAMTTIPALDPSDQVVYMDSPEFN